jgi:hypothetical protein
LKKTPSLFAEVWLKWLTAGIGITMGRLHSYICTYVLMIKFWSSLKPVLRCDTEVQNVERQNVEKIA